MSDQTPTPEDDALRAALHAEAEGVTADADLLDRIHAAAAAPPSRWARRAPWLLAAAAAAVVVAIGATVVLGDDDQSLDVVNDPSTTTVPPSSSTTTTVEDTTTTTTDPGPSARPAVAVAVTADGRLVVIDVTTGREVRELVAFDDPTDPADAEQEGGPHVITGVALHPNGRDVYYDTCCEPASGDVQLITIDGSTTSQPVTAAYGIDISADGRWLVGVAGGVGILHYDLENHTGVLLGNNTEAPFEWDMAAINADGTELTVARTARDDAGQVTERTIERYAIVDGDIEHRGSVNADGGAVPLYTPDPAAPGVALLAAGGRDLNVDASGTWMLEVDAAGRLVQRVGSERVVLSQGPFVAADW